MSATPEYQPRDGFLVNLKDGPRRFPAVYYFPGTGPESETCAGCANLIPARNKKGRCALWIQHRGNALDARDEGDPNWWRGLPCINGDTPACKYWVRRENDR